MCKEEELQKVMNQLDRDWQASDERFNRLCICVGGTTELEQIDGIVRAQKLGTCRSDDPVCLCFEDDND